MKLAVTLALISVMSISPAGIALAQDAEARAAKEYNLSSAVATASRQWRDAFNAGDAAGAAAMYEEDAVMIAKPFGRFEGREAIQAFWQQIIDSGYDDVVYFNTTTKILDQDLTTA